MGQPEQFSIGVCTPQHREEQTRLFNACFKKQIQPSDLVWRYDDNPHGQGLSLLARPEGGEGVSGYACSPRRALVRGEPSSLAPIGQTGDVMTHPEWRKRGIFSGLDRRAMEETAKLGWPLVFGLPNRRSAHIFLELGWEAIGKIRPWTFALQVSAESKAARRVDGRLKVWGLRGARKQGAKARSALREATGGQFGVHRITRFNDQVDAISKQVEKQFALMVRRDHEYLNWRFIDNVNKCHTPLGVFDAAGKLAAYVVVQDPRPGEVVGYLVDVLAANESALAQAMEAGIAHLYAAGAHLVQATCIDESWWEGKLRMAGFQPPREENHLIVILHTHQADHPLASAAREAKDWYLTDGDRDDETMG
ncbi:MAG: putative N-acetyltransferase YhbS [Candidatus Paceibacteria bacterium]|jgi:predicted N-acetyltransferase YhbS